MNLLVTEEQFNRIFITKEHNTKVIFENFSIPEKIFCIEVLFDLNPTPEIKALYEQIKYKLDNNLIITESFFEKVGHTLLDIVGAGGDAFFGAGAAANVTNTLWYAKKGEWIQALLSFVSAIPAADAIVLPFKSLLNKFGFLKTFNVLSKLINAGKHDKAFNILAKMLGNSKAGTYIQKFLSWLSSSGIAKKIIQLLEKASKWKLVKKFIEPLKKFLTGLISQFKKWTMETGKATIEKLGAGALGSLAAKTGLRGVIDSGDDDSDLDDEDYDDEDYDDEDYDDLDYGDLDYGDEDYDDTEENKYSKLLDKYG